MNQIKVISFDAEGTLVTSHFSDAVWNEAVPAHYARRAGTSLEEAKAQVMREYREVGPQRMEWYDIGYWFRRFNLSDYQGLLNSHRHIISFYPEVEEVLFSLGSKYQLIVASGSAREFLDLQLDGIQGHFARIFSSVSDYRGLKTADFYRDVCRAMHVQPGEVVHVGDDWDFDFLAPQEVGIRAFFLDRKGKGQGEGVVGNLLEFEAKLLEASSPI